MVDLKEVGKRIKDLREEAGLTQAKVAEYLSLDQSMMAKMEKGERTISTNVIHKLSCLFCCPESYLLLEDDNPGDYMLSFHKTDLTFDDLNTLATINKLLLNQNEIDHLLGGRHEK